MAIVLGALLSGRMLHRIAPVKLVGAGLALSMAGPIGVLAYSVQTWARCCRSYAAWRDQLFRPKPRVSSLIELNGWLEDQCIAYAKRHKYPEFKERTIWEVFQEEQASLVELRGPFDGFVEKTVRATTTCLIMADHNRYSVDARAAGRMVLVRSHAERIVVLLGDEVVADHVRQFRRNQVIYDPWHYLPVLTRKPGALRNGAPFKDWALPAALAQVRLKLKQHADGDQQFVKVLSSVLDHGLSAVESACAEALEAGSPAAM